MTTRIRTIDLATSNWSLFEGGPGDRVRVLFGATWLTQEGEPGDAVLLAGSELPLQRRVHAGRGSGAGAAASPGRQPATRRLPCGWRGVCGAGCCGQQFGPAKPEPVA